MKRQITQSAIAAVTLWLAAHPSLDAAPLKVFIMAGQSNMQGYANTSTIDYVKHSPGAAGLYDLMTDAQGVPVVSDHTWISSYSEERSGKSLIKEGKLTVGFGARKECLGPEFTFGLTLEQSIKEPILIIKTAWGGKSLHTDFRPPSGGMDDKQKTRNRSNSPSHYYHLMIAHIRRVLDDPAKVCPLYNEADGYEIAGFVWFQGWNDMTDTGIYPQRIHPDGYAEYTRLMGHLIRDIRRELETPDLPFVIGVMGVGGKIDLANPGQHGKIHHHFRQAQAATAMTDEFKDTVTNVFTEECWDPMQKQARDKKAEIDKRLKAIEKQRGGNLPYKERQEMFMQMLTGECTPEVVNAYHGMSNAEYHYLGSARITGCIGRKFAQAMLPLVK